MTVRPTVRPARTLGIKALTVMLVFACATALTFPARAAAAPLSELDIILMVSPQSGAEPVLLVAGQLPEATPLPAEIVLPVPEGSVVSWSGEILGGPVQNDPEVEARLEERDGMKVAVFPLSVSRVGQIEVTFPDSVAPGEGGAVAAGYSVVSPVDIAAVRMAVAVPPTYEVTSLPEGTLSSTGPQGDIYYYQEIGATAPGDPIEYGIQYSPATLAPASGPAGATPAGEFPLLMVLLVAAALAGALLVFFAARSRAAALETGDAPVEYEPYLEPDEDPIFDDVDEVQAPPAKRRKGSM